MANHTRRDSSPTIPSNYNDAAAMASDSAEPTNDLLCAFGTLDGIDTDDFREIAYEIFFTACRSSPGFGGRNALNYYPAAGAGVDGASGDGGGMGSPMKEKGVGMAVTSRVKRTLGLKMLRRSQSRRTSSVGVASSPSSPANHHGGGGSPGAAFSTVPGVGKIRRPMTSAEIMRQQMRVTEQSDNRLRKTLMRTLVGQVRNTWIFFSLHILTPISRMCVRTR